jgi:hypothetical protein
LLTSRTSFFKFRPLRLDDVAAAVQSLPDRSCASDPLPTRLLKKNVDILVPFLTDLFNCSVDWCHPGHLQGRLYYAAAQEAMHGPRRSKVISTDFQPIRGVKIIGAIGRLTADRSLNCFQSCSRRIDVTTGRKLPF